ncbi:MAG: S9 family peptidase, partial [Pseudomonadota bacterium]
MAPRIDAVIEQVGRTRVDPYNWLKDENWQEVMADPTVLRQDIRDYLEAENAYTKGMLEEPTEALREELFEEMRGRIKEDDSSLPRVEGPWAYLTRYRTGGEYPIIARKPAAELYDTEAEDQILLDGDEMGASKAYFSFGDLENSPDHKIIAYSYDDQGSEFYDIKFRDVETGEDLPDMIPRTYGSMEWAADSKTLYWVERDDNSRPVAVHAYTLGGEGSVEVYREENPGFFVGVGKSASGEYIMISAGDHTTSEVHFIPADAPAGTAPTLIAPR